MSSSARLNAIWERTVEKLREVVLEFGVTEDELHQAGDYFDRLGQSGMSRSLLDVALAMASLEATNAAQQGTRANLEGPYHKAHPVRPDGRLLDRPSGPDDRPLVLHGSVLDVRNGAPIPGARLDFWQADGRGLYDRAGDHLRGIVAVDAEGHYRIETVMPSDYAEHDSDPIGELFHAMGRTNVRAAHIHVKIEVDGQERLTTQLFMPTSAYLDRDYVQGAVSDDLTVRLATSPDGSLEARFDFRVVGRP